jgi:hypothetical protein
MATWAAGRWRSRCSRKRTTSADRPRLHRQEQPAVPGDALIAETWSRSAAPAARASACGRIDPDNRRQQVDAGLVAPGDGALAGAGFASSAGHRSARQARIGTSSRRVVRRTGFYGVQPIARSSRLTRAEWYRAPKTRSITAATRWVVQTSPRKPNAAAPKARKKGVARVARAGASASAPGRARRRAAPRRIAPPGPHHWLTPPR